MRHELRELEEDEGRLTECNTDGYDGRKMEVQLLSLLMAGQILNRKCLHSVSALHRAQLESAVPLRQY